MASPCGSGKQSYATARIAWRAVRASRRRWNSTDDQLRPYQCRLCSAWHIGHWKSDHRIQVRAYKRRLELRRLQDLWEDFTWWGS